MQMHFMFWECRLGMLPSHQRTLDLYASQDSQTDSARS